MEKQLELTNLVWAKADFFHFQSIFEIFHNWKGFKEDMVKKQFKIATRNFKSQVINFKRTVQDLHEESQNTYWEA
jgi:hypothetical protein